MASKGLFGDITITALVKAAEGTYRRQEVIAGNIANAETPGYRARRVVFEESLREALSAAPQRRQEALSKVNIEVVTAGTAPLRRDGNNVDLEAELIALGDNSLRYKLLTKLLHKKLQMLHEAIKGGAG